MRIKIVIALIVATAALAAGAAAFWPFTNRRVLILPGVVEVQEVRLGSKVGGRVEQVHVKEGAVIDKYHRALIVFEAPELNNQKRQAQARLNAAEAELARAISGPRPEEKDTAAAAMNSAWARWERVDNGFRPEEIQQAKSDFEAAKADYDQAVKDWKRILELKDQKAVAPADVDLALATRDRAKGRTESAHAKDVMMKIGSRQEDKDEAWQEYKRASALSELLRKGTRQEDIDIAQAKVAELKASLEAIDINLAETTLTVPANLGKAVVEVVAVRPGDLVAPNQPIVRVLRVQDLWVKVYVPETQYGLVLRQQNVDVTIDSYPGKIFKGVVEQRSNISEFTPRNVQSVDERRHQVFGVKIRVDDPQGVLNAGMAAEVSIPLQ